MRIIIILLLLIGFSIADRSESLPFSETFNTNNDSSDLAWLANGATWTWMPSGGFDGNACIKLTPPTSTDAGNGTYSAVGAFTGLNTAILNVRFLMKVGSSYSETAVNGTGNKFFDIFGNSDRQGLLHLWKPDVSPGWYSFTQYESQSHVAYFYDGTPTNNQSGIDTSGYVKIGTPTADENDKWICVEFINNSSIDSAKVYIWTQDSTYYGHHYTIYNNIRENIDRFYIGGFYNDYHADLDQNSYIMIDDISATATMDVIGPPTGFYDTEADSSAASQKKTDVVNVEEN